MHIIRRFQSLLGLTAFFIALNGCSIFEKQQDKRIYWPPPPADPYLIYEGSLRTKDDLKPDNAEARLKRFSLNSDAKPEEIVYVKPYDVAASQGIIAVSDTMAGIVHIFDAVRQKVFPIGWRGDGRLGRPLGVAMDGNKNIYVADAVRKVVLVFDELGHYKGVIGTSQSFLRISDVAVNQDGSRIYIVDRGGVDSDQHRVSVFNAQGQILYTLGDRGSAPGKFNHPVSIATGPSGDVYVLDSGNFRVQQFSPDGKFVRQWGRPGRIMGSFARPRGIAVDKNAYVYVSDSAFQNVQIFDTQGQLLLPFGQGGESNRPGHYTLPAGVAVDESGYIYIVDQIQRKVEIVRLLTEEERLGLRKNTPKSLN